MIVNKSGEEDAGDGGVATGGEGDGVVIGVDEAACQTDIEFSAVALHGHSLNKDDHLDGMAGVHDLASGGREIDGH